LNKPPHFDVDEEYPLLVLATWRPQTMWGDSWATVERAVFSGAGYVTLLITGAGRRDWAEIHG